MRRIFSKAILAWVVVAFVVVQASPANAAGPAASQSASCGTYVVKAGDTISSLSLKLDISHVGLVNTNSLSDARGVRAGQKLILPCETPSPGRAPQAHHLKSTAAAPGNPLPQFAASGAKVVYVSIAKQRAYAYQGDQLVYSFVVSTALPQYGTKRGTFKIKTKLPEAYSGRWQLRMPFWLGVYDAGPSENGFHALPINKRGQRLWAGLLGRPASFGCIILSTRDAAVLYNWVELGTTVVIR